MATRRPLDFDPIAAAERRWKANGWAAAAPGMAAVTSVMRAQQIYQARVDQVLRPLELSFARYELLMLLCFSRAGSLPLSKVGARLQVHPTSVTNAVDRLEAQGLIRRVPHESDRRTTLAEILPEGRDVAAKATEELNRQVFEHPGIDEPDAAALVEVLQRLRSRAGDFEGPEASGAFDPGPGSTGSSAPHREARTG